MNLAIETRSLTRHYGATVALDGLDWQVPVGSACAFLGPNGAGKSTALRLVMGFTPPTRGDSRVLGEDPWEMSAKTRARVGYVAEQPILPPWMKVGALLAFHRSLYPRWDAALERELVDLLELAPGKRVSELSKGQHRRVMLTLALAQGGDLLILDEPGSGLDVAARRQLLSLLADFLGKEGRTLVFSTHIVTDVERIANHVSILDRGRLVANDELDDLHENVKSVTLPRASFDRARARWEDAGILERKLDAHVAELVVRRFASHGQYVLRDLSEGPVTVEHGPHEDVWMGTGGEAAQVRHMALEDIFLALTSGEREEAVA